MLDPSEVGLGPLVIALGALALVGFERARPQTPGQRLFRAAWATDLFAYTLAQSYVLGLVVGSLLAALAQALPSLASPTLRSWPLPAQLAFFVVTHDFVAYWIHRAEHRFPRLWRIHEAHHSASEVDWLAGSRSHPLEIVLGQSVEFAPIVLLGAGPEVALAKGVVDALWGMFIHANIDVRLGWLGVVVNGPELHRHHHALGVGGRTNFGTKLALWDRFFGTLHWPREAPSRFGVLDPDYPTGYFAQTLYAFRRIRERTPRSGTRARQPSRA